MSLQSPTLEKTPILIHSEKSLAFNTAAAGAFIFWEFCLTFSQEVDFVWRRRWGTIEYLFIFIRYGSFIIRTIQLLSNLGGFVHLSVATCQNLLKLEGIIGHAILLSVDVLLAIRTYAFYGQDRKVLFLLIGIILAGQAASLTILVIILPGFVSIASGATVFLNIGACEVVGADAIFPNYLVPTLIVEGCLTLLVATKFSYDKVMGNMPTCHTLVVFIRDGAWAFAIVFAGLVWTVVTYGTDPIKGDVAITWLFSILSFSGTRLILNLRSEASGNNIFSGLYTETNISFGSLVYHLP